jgi:hypothetical protein
VTINNTHVFDERGLAVVSDASAKLQGGNVVPMRRRRES